MSNNYIDELFDNLRRDPFNNNPTNDTSYELQKDFLSDPQGPEGWIADGVITDVELADGSTTITNVTSLPTLPLDAYPVGKVVYLTTDGKLYRNIAEAWSAAVAAVNLTGQITDTQITDSAITTQKIAANAIVADKIAANAITSDKIIANAITTGKIAAGSITAASGIIADAAISNAKIIDATITGAKIASATITSANITTLTAEKIVSGPFGLYIQGASSGVDAAFGGVDDALFFSGVTLGLLGTTSVGDAALLAPNKIYMSPDAIVLPDTTTGSGISIVGEEGVSITSPQVLVGTEASPLTGDTAYFGPSVFGGMPNGVIIYSELDDVTLEAAGVVNLNAPTTEVSGDLNVQGAITIQGAGIIPPGVVQSYLGAYTNIPTGWLFCNGAAVSRTTYADLFAVIGTTFGAGNGTTTFTLPNLFGHMLVGGTSTTTPGTASQTGSADSYLNATWDHNHIHSHVTDPAATNSGTASASAGGTQFQLTGSSTSGHIHSTNIAATTSDTDSTTMSVAPTQKRTRVNYIIKT